MNTTNIKNKLFVSLTSAGVAGVLLVASAAFAQTTPTPQGGSGEWGGRGAGMTRGAPGVFGTVSAISGESITLTSKGFGQNATPTTYTVDATNATVTKDGASSSVSAIAVGDTLMVQGTVSGTTVTATKIDDGMGGRGPGMAPGVFGTVASISGNSISVTSKGGPNGAAGTTYTVDATNATVTKDGTASSVSTIVVGDTVMVEGTVSGTTVTATTIRDGMLQGGQGVKPAAIIQGNGEPVIGGAVTAISGDSLTVTNKSNVTYTVDATNAVIQKGNATSSVSAIVVGDNVVVQGTVNGNAVTASSVIDSGVKPTSTSGDASSGGTGPTAGFRGGFGGILGSIGNLFHSLFGFF